MSGKFRNCLDSAIGIVVAFLAAIIIILFLHHVRADEAPKCQPLDLVQQRAKLVGFPLSHWRKVAPKFMGVINEGYASLVGTPVNPPWTLAVLADAPNGEGVMMVGYGNEVCKVAVFKAEVWRQLVFQLEGHSI